MADTEEKKKKKKSKKEKPAENIMDDPPPPWEMEPEPAADEEAKVGEDGAWPPEMGEEAPAGEGEAPAEGEAPPAEGEEGMEDFEPQQIEKRKSPYPVFWNRPKAKMYRMNFDYGENYYSNMVAYLNSKSGITHRGALPPPKAQSWAERALKSASLRYPRQEADLSSMLSSVRSNIRDYDHHHRLNTARVQAAYGGLKSV